jgi:Domain of unknown function (DUF222)
MPQGLFPDPGPDDAEPDGSPLDEDAPGPEQGLYITLPAEQLTLSGFSQGGASDTMAPGPLLAAVVHTVTGEDGSGLAGCSDDQLMGIISAARRQQSRDEWTVMAAIGEFARRAGAGVEGEFAADELALELHMSQQSAAGQMDFATEVPRRLPKTFAALGAGQIHPIHLRIIEEETRYLTDADAAKADAVLAEAAPGKTFGELRYAARKLVLTLDPDIARKRKEAARREAHVRQFQEESGNAGMVARELPPDEVLASWQHVEQRALDLRAAGAPGTLQELRVQAYLDLLQERDSRTVLGGPPASGEASQDQPASDQPASDQPASDQPPSDSDPSGPPGADPGPGGPDGPGHEPGGPGGPGGSGGPGPAPRPSPGAGPSLAALVTLTIPLTTYQGRSEAPGEADGFGILDGDDARDVAAAAARHLRTRWCITALNPDGTAAAHACLPGRHPPPGTGPPGTGPPHAGPPSRHPPPGRANLTVTSGPGLGPDPPAGTRPQDYLRSLDSRLVPVARGHCDHAHAETGYRPSRKLQHLVRARSARCTAPGCGRPAARCDLDHTVPWDQGGITCECDLAPLCRHHHRCKQGQGWSLEQPEPGVLRWRVPSGRTYATTPTDYSL